MAAFQVSRMPGAVCPPPVCPCHAASFQHSLRAHRHSATPNTAAGSYACHQRRSGRVAASDKERQYRADFEKRIEEEDAAVEAEAAPSMEAQLQALRSQGPPPGMSPEDFEKEMAQYEQAMQDPAKRRQMEEMQAMAAQPQVQEQMAQMAAVMQNTALMERMEQLKGDEMLARIEEMQDDPEFVEFFKAVQTGGAGALQQYMGNPEFLAKLGQRVGDIDLKLPGEKRPAAPPGAAAAGPPGGGAPPEIENLLQAAKYGDLEATEDLIAVGHDTNATDAEKRTPLHYAVAYRYMPIAQELLRAGANVEARDSKGNTPLHYAAGYGRGEFVASLLEAGADGTVKNDSDHTPYELVSMEQRNPLNQELETLQKLQAAAGA